MNKRNTQAWELRMGLPHVVVLIGVLTGTMACAFGIGYVTGQSVGFENALASGVSSLPKYPIAISEVAELEDSDVEQVYAKMQADPFEKAEAESEQDDLPVLGEIKDSTESPVVDDLVVDLLNEEKALQAENISNDEEQGVDAESDVAIRVLDGSASKTATLGSIRAKDQAVEETAIAKIAKTDTTDSNANPKVEQTSVEKAPVEPKKPKAAVLTAPVENAANESIVKEQMVRVPPKSTTSALQRGWYTQVAAPKARQDANALASKLRASGFPVAIEQATVRGDTYFRVLVGPEENRARGEILLNQVKRERYLSGQPFIRMIK